MESKDILDFALSILKRFRTQKRKTRLIVSAVILLVAIIFIAVNVRQTSDGELLLMDNDGKELISAATDGNFEKVKRLIEDGANVNAKDEHGRTALSMASEKGYLEIVKYLIEKRANINAEVNYGETVLMAASKFGRLEVVQYLVEKGVKINAKNNYNGLTALMWASFNGNLGVVKYLIEKGADINAKSKEGTTALIWASENGNLEVVKYLIGKGADINAKNNEGKTAVDLADTDEIRELIQMATNDSFDKSKLLVELVEEENVISNDKDAVMDLIRASENGNLETVKDLMEIKRVNINAKNENGETALMFASKEGNLEVAKYLVENGADILIRNNDGKTAVDLAKNEEIRKLIITESWNR